MYGLAMASPMGLPPVLGVFTSILTAPVIALLGRRPSAAFGSSSFGKITSQAKFSRQLQLAMRFSS
jgi:MFS superfamily sulfate permease-like transporter